MKRFVSKSKDEIINSGIILNVIIVIVVSLLTTMILNIFRVELYELFIQNNSLKKFGIVKFWDSSRISNFNLYLFAGQIALVALVGTAVSFVAHLLENKKYGFKIKEILTYRYSKYNKTIVDYVFINFILVVLGLFLLVTRYSEIAFLITFCVVLYNTIKVFLIIADVFFNDAYLKERTVLMIQKELNSVKVINDSKNHEEAMNFNYTKVESILNRIKGHTFEVLRGPNYEEYIENVEIVCKLGVELNVESTDDIMTSILYGWYIEKVATYLYENGYDNELVNLANYKLIKENCNPSLVSISNRKVAEMYSSHYCQALLMIHRYNFITQLSKESLDYGKSLKLAIEGFNSMYEISKEFQNYTFSNMNRNNWSNFIVNSIARIQLYDQIHDKNYTKKFISDLEKCKTKNDWIVDIIKHYNKKK